MRRRIPVGVSRLYYVTHHYRALIGALVKVRRGERVRAQFVEHHAAFGPTGKRVRRLRGLRALQFGRSFVLKRTADNSVVYYFTHRCQELIVGLGKIDGKAFAVVFVFASVGGKQREEDDEGYDD